MNDSANDTGADPGGDSTADSVGSSHDGANGGSSTLLLERRFGPLFATQFLGAFNDNLYKTALVVLVAFGAVEVSLSHDLIINLGAMLFIAPFFVFSAAAGQLADAMERSLLIRRLKLAEVGVALVAAIGVLTSSVTLMLLALVLYGTQSTFFGPVKYAILPQHLKMEELSAGNGYIEMGTFIAILTGTLLGSLAASESGTASVALCAGIIAVAGLGVWTSRYVPHAPAPAPSLKIDWNVPRATLDIVRDAREVHSVLLSILGISWFWFFGALYITQVPNYAGSVLQAHPSVSTILLATFSIGIGVGSMLCSWASGRRIELGLVPLGALGMTVFGLRLAMAPLPVAVGEELGYAQFLTDSAGLRIIFDLIMISVSGGFFIVPLYAFIQYRTASHRCARVIAANNILNALFIFAAGVFAIAMLENRLSIPQLYGVVAVMNGAVSLFIFWQVPEFVVRLFAWLLAHSAYRITNTALDNIPRRGSAVIVCNHVSFADALLIMAVCPRPIRFVMDHRIFRWRVMGFVFRCAKAIPIAPAREDAVMLKRAYDDIALTLEDDELIGIFPEGRLTSDGEIGVFRPGIEKILARTPVPVVPLALRGVWGSVFSRQGGRALSRPPSKLWRRIEVVSAPAVAPEDASAEGLREIVAGLRGDMR
ncbi:MAG: MFS transporter [Gammaproteobacteria bacterium]